MKPETDDNTRPASLGELLRLAWPLVVSNSFFTLQVAIDRSLLAQHSSVEVGAAMAAILLFWTPFGLLQFTANYISTFVAQYVGAGRPERVGPAIGQALYFSIFAGLGFLAIVAPLSGALIALGGHEPELQKVEAEYLYCLAFAALPMLLNAAAQSFFTGRGESKVILFTNGCGFVVNALLCFAWIHGRWGFRELGIAGAGWATVAGSWTSAILALALLLRRRYRQEYATHSLARFEPALFGRLLRFGLPNGLMVALDGLAFTLFTFLVGTLGTTEMAATSVAFTLNTVAFMPAMGLGQAVEILVGQRLGADRPDRAEQMTMIGLWTAFAYMAIMAFLYAFLPGLLLMPFANDRPDWAGVAAMVTGLLRFVAIYSLFDAVNLVISFALRGAGDTRFVMAIAFGLAWPLMILPTWAITKTGWGQGCVEAASRLLGDPVSLSEMKLYAAWLFASLYIAATGAVYYLRFRHGAWKSMRVIEPAVTEGRESQREIIR